MLDGQGKEINYLRVSITDRCNLRYQYCMPETGISYVEHTDILSLEDPVRLIEVGASIGNRKIRLRGGEPLVRKNISQLIHYINNIKEIDDLVITTNGSLFAPRADEMKAAGLRRLNFSMDSLVAEKYRYITRAGDFSVVRKSTEKAQTIKELISINGGNLSGIACGEVDPLGIVHPDQFTQHITFGNVCEGKIGKNWHDMSHPILAEMKNRKPFLKGRCAKCQYLDLGNGNFRTRAEPLTVDSRESDPAGYLTDEEIGLQ